MKRVPRSRLRLCRVRTRTGSTIALRRSSQRDLRGLRRGGGRPHQWVSIHAGYSRSGWPHRENGCRRRQPVPRRATNEGLRAGGRSGQEFGEKTGKVERVATQPGDRPNSRRWLGPPGGVGSAPLGPQPPPGADAERKVGGWGRSRRSRRSPQRAGTSGTARDSARFPRDRPEKWSGGWGAQRAGAKTSSGSSPAGPARTASASARKPANSWIDFASRPGGSRRHRRGAVEIGAGLGEVSQPMVGHGQEEEVEGIDLAAVGCQASLQNRDRLVVPASRAVEGDPERVEVDGFAGFQVHRPTAERHRTFEVSRRHRAVGQPPGQIVAGGGQRFDQGQASPCLRYTF